MHRLLNSTRPARLQAPGIVRLLIVGAVVSGIFGANFTTPTTTADEPDLPQPQPVDESMHHFMEYVFEPAYKRMKSGLAKEPADNVAWKGVKGDALTLAEGSNLLLLRAPEEERKSWSQLSVEVRELAAKVYQAGREKDYAKARPGYEALITRCNACHQQFADGEHQLTP